MKLHSCRLFFTFFEVILGISATTHWVVTENGRIQSQHDEVFQMRRPYDLLAFLEQEKRKESADTLHRQMLKRIAALDHQFKELNTVSDVRSYLHSKDPDCLSLSQDTSVEDIDLFASVANDGAYREGVTQKDFLLDGIPNEGKKKIPDCKKTFPLDFSMYTFEHFSAMRNRKNLTQHQETGLIKYLPPGMDLNKFGHTIAYGLIRNSTSWLHLNLAAIYWRVKGDAYNALECSRRAIVTAPRRYRDIPLLTAGGILHAARHSAEAAIILHTAIDYAPTESQQHLALGHVYAVLGDYNRSIACYDNCLRLSPTMDQARHAKFAIFCYQKLENELTLLHRKMQDALTELSAYHTQQEQWLELQEQMLWEANEPPLRKIHIGMTPNNEYNSILGARGQSCMQKENEAVVSCDVTTNNQLLTQNFQIDISVSLQQLQNIESQAKKISEQMSKSKVLQAVDRTANCQESKEKGPEFFAIFMEPTGRPKYYNFEVKVTNEVFENKDWPKSADCREKFTMLGDTKDYLPLYLPPENKGYATHLFVSELIGLDPDKEHSLPWYPPICESPKKFDQKYISHALLKATVGNSSPDTGLSSFLTELVSDAEIAEIGQRILTATKSKVAAPWVLSMLASLHWRIVGKPRNALDCLQLALDEVPKKFKDVPLVSIASINQKVGLIDDALKISQEAWEINSVEPVTNLLVGLLLHIKGNDTGSIYHLKRTLRVDSDALNGKVLETLKSIACQKKLTEEDENRFLKENQRKVTKNGILTLEASTLNKILSKTGSRCGDQTEKQQSLIDTIISAGSRLDESELENFVDTEQSTFHMRISLGGDPANPRSNSHILDDLYVSMVEDNPSMATLQVHDKSGMISLSPRGCKDMQHAPWLMFHSVWHHVTSRNIDISNDIKPLPNGQHQEPVCEGGDPDIRYLADMDELSQNLPRLSEPDAAEWLALMTGDESSSIQQLGTRIALALQKNATSWTLAMAAAFYWRVEGDSRKAIDCIRQSLVNTPKDMQDIPLINLASLLSGRGFHHHALQVAQWALVISPDFVINHFTIANLHIALGDFEKAISFYRSSLVLDPTFEPARNRLQAILCLLLFDESTKTLREMIGNN